MRVGVDLVCVDDVARSIETFGERYLGRVFTPAELVDCDGPEPARSRSLAARFAAKEATIKVLRPGAAGLGWRSIEVVRARAGHPELALHGTARALADEAGIGEPVVSLSHEGGLAVAVVMAPERAVDVP